MLEKIKTIVQRLAKIPDRNKLQDEWVDFLASKEAKLFNSMVKKWVNGNQSTGFESSHASFLEELKALASSEHKNSLLFFLKGIDAIFDLEDVESIERRVSECIKILHSAKRRGNNVYFVACGSSFHAAKTAPLFFNEIARLSVIPLLPGEFRTQCSNSLCDGDVIIGISQSGETKDLIDIFNMVSQSKKSVKCICILNNTNSTLALEKSDVFIPLLCGPEIAVPATKSFMSQLLVLFILAIRLDELSRKASKKSSQNASASKDYLSMIEQIPDLIDLTLKSTSNEIEKVSSDLCLHPSIHILATRINGVAKEGALKIREIVLNHTEGFEGSEFKHGPNTILGLNTIFGFDSLSAVLHSFCDSISPILMDRKSISLQMGQIFNSFINAAFKAPYSKLQNIDDENLFQKIFQGHRLFENLYKNYPLLFITSPEKQDIHLTISQINTHKIRGADVYLVAEDDEQLQKAVSIPPAGAGSYQFGYIIIPKTGNPLLAPFSITVVLQLLALKMSQKKMEFLKTLKIFNHGVHPDSPKNVSKSITVD